MIIRYKKECDPVFSFSFSPVTMPRGLVMNSSPGIQMKLLSTPHFSQSPPLNQTAGQGVLGHRSRTAQYVKLNKPPERMVDFIILGRYIFLGQIVSGGSYAGLASSCCIYLGTIQK